MTKARPEGVTPTEQFLAELCGRSFLRLWSYANPYKDDGHEFCDILAVFDNHVFIFFDREKQLADLTEEENPDVRWDRWKRDVIDRQSILRMGLRGSYAAGARSTLTPKKLRNFLF